MRLYLPLLLTKTGLRNIYMARQPVADKEKCPFWSSNTMKCRISKGGLFIPLDDHISVYCTSFDYPQCLQYSLQENDPATITQIVDQIAENRRKHKRIATQQRVTLVQSTHSGKIISHKSAVAHTLDVSQGGMRLSTFQPLRGDSIVEFSFHEPFPLTLHSALGHVAWCNKQINEPGYQAGIAFKNERVIQAMGNFLGANFEH